LNIEGIEFKFVIKKKNFFVVVNMIESLW
jgi:hypothetical protein